MENENKERIELTDEELMAVAGGEKITNQGIIDGVIRKCSKYIHGANQCMSLSNKRCVWIDNQCVPDPNKYEY